MLARPWEYLWRQWKYLLRPRDTTVLNAMRIHVKAVRACRGHKNACEGRVIIFDGLEFFPVSSLENLLFWILIQNYSLDPQHCSPKSTLNSSKSDLIQIILLDSASSSAKNVEVVISWHCPWSSFCPPPLPLHRLSIWSLNFFSSSVCIGIVPASNETSILRLQHQLRNNFSHQLLLHSFATTNNQIFALVKASISFALQPAFQIRNLTNLGPRIQVRNPDTDLDPGPKRNKFFWRTEVEKK